MNSPINPEDYDDDEPFVIEGERLGAVDIAPLTGVPIAADSCVFAGCDLSIMRFCGVKNTRFESSKLRGAIFAKHLINVVFDTCKLTECLFRMMVLKNVAFEKSQLTECDFYGSELTDLVFPGSEFEGVGFDACTLTNMDLSEAAMLLIGDPRTLKGATICETQVPLLAHRLAVLSGIEVLDC